MSDISTDPLVSVVIPSYRATEFLAEALDSVFRQSYRNLEVLVVDQDQDSEADRILGPLEHRIRRLRLSPPSVSAARNLAILEAKGSIIAQLDADDVWEEHAVRVLVDTLLSRNAGLVFGNALFFGDVDEQTASKTFRDVFPAHRPVTYDDVASLRTGIFVSVAGWRDLFIDAGLYDPAFRYGEDFDLWLRMLLKGAHIDFTDEVICRYRRRAGAACNDPVVDRLHRLVAIYDKHLVLDEVPPSSRRVLESARNQALSALAWEEAKEGIRNGDFRTARKALERLPKEQLSLKHRAVNHSLRLLGPVAGPLLRWWLEQTAFAPSKSQSQSAR